MGRSGEPGDRAIPCPLRSPGQRAVTAARAALRAFGHEREEAA